jgi:hypothetical protein
MSATSLVACWRQRQTGILMLQEAVAHPEQYDYAVVPRTRFSSRALVALSEK